MEYISASLQSNEGQFIASFILDEKMVLTGQDYKREYGSPDRAKEKSSKWVMRTKLGEKWGLEPPSNVRNYSLHIKDEEVAAILEYARDKFIFSLDPRDLLIVTNWKKVRLADPDINDE